MMSVKRRILLLEVLGEFIGKPKAIDVANRLRFFEGLVIDQKDACDDVLSWLIKNKLTGQKFLDWYDGDCRGSALVAGSYVFMKIKKQKEMQPLYVGRDVKPN